MAVDTVQKSWQQIKGISSPEKAEVWIDSTLNEINKNIYKQAMEREEYQGMGTTAVLALCTREFVKIGHIGDSCCYINSESGIKQLTEDHSLVNELVKTGQISTEDAEHHPRKNIVLKALGTEKDIHADIKSLAWDEHDRLLLCSDGLTYKVSDDELEVYIRSKDNLKTISQTLIQMANERGGEDNISLVIVDCIPEEAGDASC